MATTAERIQRLQAHNAQIVTKGPSTRITPNSLFPSQVKTIYIVSLFYGEIKPCGPRTEWNQESFVTYPGGLVFFFNTKDKSTHAVYVKETANRCEPIEIDN